MRMWPDPQMSFEGVTGTRRYIVEVRDSLFKIEFFILGSDAFAQERFSRRVKVDFDGREVFVPTPEDVIVAKVRWLVLINHPKDAQDIMDVISVQGDALDWDYIYRWADEHGSRKRLDEVRASLPPLDGV